jgi:hypothetical protein
MDKKQRITYEKANATLRNNTISTYLPTRYLDHFHSLWLKSRRESKELTGQIKIKAIRHQNKLEIRYDLINIKQNNTATNRSVAPQIGTIVYHTHPGSTQIPVNAFLLPSDNDMEVYIKQYPRLQFNIVADSHGIYIVTLNPAAFINVNKLLTTWHDIAYTHLSPYLQSTNKMGYYIFPNNNIKIIMKYINKLMNPLGLKMKYIPYNNKERIPVTFLSTRPIRNLPIVEPINMMNINNKININSTNNNQSNLNINNSIHSLINRNRRIVSAVSEYSFPNTEKNRKKMVRNAYTNFKTTRLRNKKPILGFKSFMNRLIRLSRE